jgi:hypothetical protein
VDFVCGVDVYTIVRAKALALLLRVYYSGVLIRAALITLILPSICVKEAGASVKLIADLALDIALTGLACITLPLWWPYISYS